MIEIELFFKTVESEIRRKHINYLKEQKCLPDKDITAAEEVITAEELKKAKKTNKGFFISLILWLIERVRFVRRVKLVKRYNKGIQTALRVLQSEYRAFDKRLKAEEKRGSKRA